MHSIGRFIVLICKTGKNMNLLGHLRSVFAYDGISCSWYLQDSFKNETIAKMMSTHQKLSRLAFNDYEAVFDFHPIGE